MKVAKVGMAMLGVGLLMVLATSALPSREAARSAPYSPGIRLVSPAVAQILPPAFPYDEAAAAAYVKLETALDPKAISDRLIPAQIIQLGDNFLRAQVTIPNIRGTQDVRIYADSAGWIVAYSVRGWPFTWASIVQWAGLDEENPVLPGFTTTVLQDALQKVVEAAGLNFSDVKAKIAYYDFYNPTATNVVLLGKTRALAGTSVFKFALPPDWELIQVSLSHYDVGHQAAPPFGGAKFFRGGTLLSEIGNTINVGTFSLVNSVMHDFSLSQPTDAGSTGVAIAILYRKAQ